MEVKIKNKIYDSEKEPIMIILTDTDKENIKDMVHDNYKYCCFPDKKKYTKNNFEKISNWMKTN